MLFNNLNLPNFNLTLNTQVFHFKLAHTPQARKYGLSQIDYLPINSGLCFWYDQTRYPNATPPDLKPAITMCVPFNLTVLFLTKQGKIVKIFPNLPAEPNTTPDTATKYYCPHPADGMLEIPGNTPLNLKTTTYLDLSNLIAIF